MAALQRHQIGHWQRAGKECPGILLLPDLDDPVHKRLARAEEFAVCPKRGKPAVHVALARPVAAVREEDLHRSVLTAQPGWGALRAVREGRIFLGDGNALFNRPGPRVAETLERLAEALHPGAFRFGHEGTGWERWRGSLVDTPSVS